MRHTNYDSIDLAYSYLQCQALVIHPNIELKNIALLEPIITHFHEVISRMVTIKAVKKSKARIIDSIFARWYFAQFVHDRCELNYYIPYNAINFQTIHEDLEYIYGEAQPILAKQVIEALNLTALCNKAVGEITAYIKNGEYNSPYQIHKSITTKYISLALEGITVTTGFRTVFVTKSVYNSLEQSYQRFSDKRESLDVLVWSLVNRYMSLKIYNLQLAILPSLYKELQRTLDLQFETFASGINKFYDHYCSLFYDIEVNFGSRGSFFGFTPKKGFYSVNPPYDIVIIQLAIARVLAALKIATQKLGFFISLPVWDRASLTILQRTRTIRMPEHITPFPAVEQIKNSGYLQYHKIFHESDFAYYDYQSAKIKKVSNTHIFVISNEDLTSIDFDSIFETAKMTAKAVTETPISFDNIIQASTDPTVAYLKLRDSFTTDRPDDTRESMYKLLATETLIPSVAEKPGTERTMERVQHLLQLLPADNLINTFLDVGCGNAEITVAIAQAYQIPAGGVYCADVFPATEFTTQTVQYSQVKDNHIDLPDQSMDLITAFVAMHHFENFDAMMKEINRILKPGGYLFFREHDVPLTRNEVIVKYLDELHTKYADHPGGPINYLNRANLKSTLVTDFGFIHIDDLDYPYPSNPQQLYHSLFKKAGPDLPQRTSTKQFLSVAGYDNYKKLSIAKPAYAKIGNFSRIRSATNPFEKIPFPILAGTATTRAGLKLANIDAIYGITMHRTGFLAKNTNNQLIFADLAGGPGGFAQYLLWRDNIAMGMGITLRTSDRGLAWDTKLLDLTRFSRSYGVDNTGNLYTNTTAFPEEFLRKFPDGADLVVADGGFSVEGREEQQEQLSTRLILTEMLTAIRILGNGPSVFVCKVFDSLTLMMAQLLYLCANVFEQIDLFKPVSSRPANSERYLICSGFKRAQATDIAYILDQANQAYADGKTPFSLIDNELPTDFLDWLKRRNDSSINLQLKSAIEIIKLARSIQESRRLKLPTTQLNLNRALVVWNLPDGLDILSPAKGVRTGARSRPVRSSGLSRRS